MAEHPILDPDNIDLSMFKAFGFKKVRDPSRFICCGEYRTQIGSFYLKLKGWLTLQKPEDSFFTFQKYTDDDDPIKLEYEFQFFGETDSKKIFLDFIQEAQKWDVHEIEAVLKNSDGSIIKFSI